MTTTKRKAFEDQIPSVFPRQTEIEEEGKSINLNLLLLIIIIIIINYS